MSTNYYNTKQKVDKYIEQAKDIDSSQLIDRLKNYLPLQSSLLEIGSGPGTDFHILKNYFKTIGSDYSREFLIRLQEKYANDTFLELNAITLSTDKRFDGIYSNKVLQHLTDEELKQSIVRQTSILNSSGIICHSFWKGEGEETMYGMLVNYQSEKTLANLFTESFDILLLEAYCEFEENDSLVLIARKK
jgi:trans-aconitate methyltransferase